MIRPARTTDQAAWRDLWTKYLEFYESSVPDAVYQSTWERFFANGTYEPHCFVAERDEKLIGLVHFQQHRHNWKIENVVYLQDLFVDPSVRGSGAGRKLIEAVYSWADENGCPTVYWNTQDFNATARQLYDRIATLTPFIKYTR